MWSTVRPNAAGKGLLAVFSEQERQGMAQERISARERAGVEADQLGKVTLSGGARLSTACCAAPLCSM